MELLQKLLLGEKKIKKKKHQKEIHKNVKKINDHKVWSWTLFINDAEKKKLVACGVGNARKSRAVWRERKTNKNLFRTVKEKRTYRTSSEQWVGKLLDLTRDI